jgi:hypothetical protein
MIYYYQITLAKKIYESYSPRANDSAERVQVNKMIASRIIYFLFMEIIRGADNVRRMYRGADRGAAGQSLPTLKKLY